MGGLSLRVSGRAEAAGRATLRQVLASQVLELPAEQLSAYVLSQVEENFALEAEELPLCPGCGRPLPARRCPLCGSPEHRDPNWRPPLPTTADDEGWNPLDLVAAPQSLQEDLKQQLGLLSLPRGRRAAARAIVDALDGRGYLDAPLFEITNPFGLSATEAEATLAQVQDLDPCGAGSRSPREFLLLQIQSLEPGERLRSAEQADLAQHMLEQCERELGDRNFAGIARNLGVPLESVQAALSWMAGHLRAYPAQGYRPRFGHLAPLSEPRVAPDVAIRWSEDGEPEVELPGADTLQVGMSQAFLEYLRTLDGKPPEEAERMHQLAWRARCLIDALERRKATLTRLTLAIARRQREFLLRGREFLKPMTQAEVAKELGLHPSTLCRAVQDKYVRLPSGEVVPFHLFFDTSLGAREVVEQIIAAEPAGRPLSDQAIQERLEALGLTIARRTVAKYREMLKIPPAAQRRRTLATPPRGDRGR